MCEKAFFKHDSGNLENCKRMDINTWITKYRDKTGQKSTKCDNGECIIWQGYKSVQQQYGFMNVLSPGERKWKKMTVHRLAYMIEHPECLQSTIDCLHLCHNKLCINAEHISLEPHGVNNNRKLCVFIGRCTGHHPYQDCRLHLTIT